MSTDKKESRIMDKVEADKIASDLVSKRSMGGSGVTPELEAELRANTLKDAEKKDAQKKEMADAVKDVADRAKEMAGVIDDFELPSLIQVKSPVEREAYKCQLALEQISSETLADEDNQIINEIKFI